MNSTSYPSESYSNGQSLRYTTSPHCPTTRVDSELTPPHPRGGLDYDLWRSQRLEDRRRPRIVPSRPGKLRRGGGCNEGHGWTDQKWRTLDKLLRRIEPDIQSAITIRFPADMCPSTYIEVNDRIRDWFRRREFRSVCVWEGPTPHCHIALLGSFNCCHEQSLRALLEKWWIKIWGETMDNDALLWKGVTNLAKMVSYLRKKQKGKTRVKASFEWLKFRPYWRVGCGYTRPSN
jgi:hypothetical protein